MGSEIVGLQSSLVQGFKVTLEADVIRMYPSCDIDDNDVFQRLRSDS